MLKITETLLKNGFRHKIFTHLDIKELLPKTKASKEALIHKAVKKHELVSIKRGVYTIGIRPDGIMRSELMCCKEIAAYLLPGYISHMMALSSHGWIPESVHTYLSVIEKGRNKEFSNCFGFFKYKTIRHNEGTFLNGVSKVEGQTFSIASPLRAIADIVCIDKINYTDIGYLTDSLRIEEDNLETISSMEFDSVSAVYKSKRVLNFLDSIRKQLGK